jgi:hypothetical protein
MTGDAKEKGPRVRQEKAGSIILPGITSGFEKNTARMQ